MNACPSPDSHTAPAPAQADRAYRAVCFDLDGTLLPMELEEFLASYFTAIGTFVAEQGLDAQAFSAGLKAGIGAMMKHDDTRTNADVFWEAFYQYADRTAADWEPILEQFYEGPFGEIGRSVQPNPATARAVETLVRKGYPLALTTMPMFPRRAVEWRLTWAGVDPACFSRLTTFENSTAVKPKLAYYAENLAALGAAGADVLMVGNNTVEDLAFMGLAADGYLVCDHLLDPVGYDLATVKHGSMEEFAAWVDTLPECADPVSHVVAGEVDPAATAAALEANLLPEALVGQEHAHAAAMAVNKAALSNVQAGSDAAGKAGA